MWNTEDLFRAFKRNQQSRALNVVRDPFSHLFNVIKNLSSSFFEAQIKS